MSEDHIWKVAQSVGFDDYELRPMLEAFATALSKPTRHLTVTTTESGEAVMVSWQDDDHRILDVVWERKVPATPVVTAEQIEDLAWLDVDEHGEIDRSSDHNKMMTAPRRSGVHSSVVPAPFSPCVPPRRPTSHEQNQRD